MRLPRLLSLPLAAAAITITSAVVSPGVVLSAQVPWDEKVDGWVLSTAGAGPTEFLVVLNEQVDVTAAEGLA